MAAAAPPPSPDPRALALLEVLKERASARLALNETLLAMESRLARVEPVPPEILQEFERRMGHLRELQEKVSELASVS